MNGNLAYNLHGYNSTVNGYFLLGNNLNLQSGGPTSFLYRDKGTLSLLHLNGAGNQVQELGYRPWIQTGITFTANNDFSYRPNHLNQSKDSQIKFVFQKKITFR